MIADRQLFARVWAEAAAGLPDLYLVLDVLEPERPDLAARLAQVANGPVRADLVVGVGEGVSGKLLDSLAALRARRSRAPAGGSI